jgi:hypothetical protein
LTRRGGEAGRARHDEETTMHETLVSQRLLALFFAAGVVFNFPLIALWDQEVVWFGIPLFPLALFVLWGLLIAALAWLMERAPD